jgi:hypothetical protein
MGFFNELVNRATGLKTGLLEEANKSTSGIGMQETDMQLKEIPMLCIQILTLMLKQLTLD